LCRAALADVLGDPAPTRPDLFVASIRLTKLRWRPELTRSTPAGSDPGPCQFLRRTLAKGTGRCVHRVCERGNTFCNVLELVLSPAGTLSEIARADIWPTPADIARAP
jgi:hypothetical protein